MNTVSIDTLIDYNRRYREGAPVVSDEDYDALFAAAKAAYPTHAFFAEPEPAEVPAGKRVKHLQPMLSTDKAYSDAEVKAWVDRVQQAIPSTYHLPWYEIPVRVTPKLDGIAAHHHADVAYTRGRGGYGRDITGLFDSHRIRNDSYGSGEIVVARNYFDTVIAEKYGLKHPRNFIAGFVDAETLEEHHRRAAADGEIRFVTHESQAGVQLMLGDLVERWQGLFEEILPACPYHCDGLVADIIDPVLRTALGSTSHHHRWQLALKVNDQFAEAKVTAIRMSTGRTGVIVPTLQIEPTELYGVTISWVTAHNVQRLLEWQCGVGSTVQITRAGGVIPAVTQVLSPAAVDPALLDRCPSCGSDTRREGPSLYCTNTETCPAQASKRLEHFFKTVSNCKGFGPAVCDQLTAAGILTPHRVFTATPNDFFSAGLSPGVTANLVSELSAALRTPISEAHLLAAFGIEDLGRGDSRKLLAVVPFENLGAITADTMMGIRGFGEKTATSISAALRALWPQIKAVHDLGWSLDKIAPAGAAQAGLLSGKTLVFTGTMASPREAMEAQAAALGATIGSSVTGKTSMLVCGDKVGVAKTDKAAKLGVTIISEADYLKLISEAA